MTVWARDGAICCPSGPSNAADSWFCEPLDRFFTANTHPAPGVGAQLEPLRQTEFIPAHLAVRSIQAVPSRRMKNDRSRVVSTQNCSGKDSLVPFVLNNSYESNGRKCIQRLIAGHQDLRPAQTRQIFRRPSICY